MGGSGSRTTARVLVCGSRDWNRPALIAAKLAELPPGSIVMHGTARGADIIAADYAYSLGFEVEHYPADWKRYGKKAGIIRNLEMLDARPNLVFAFWDGKSRGTKHVIDEARKRRIHVEVFCG